MSMIIGMASASSVLLAADSQDSGFIRAGQDECIAFARNTARKVYRISDCIATAIAGSATLNNGRGVEEHLGALDIPSLPNKECVEVIRTHLHSYTDDKHQVELIVACACPPEIFTLKLPRGTRGEKVQVHGGFQFAMKGSGAVLLKDYASNWVDLVTERPREPKEAEMVSMAVAMIHATIHIEEWKEKTTFLAEPIMVLQWSGLEQHWLANDFGCQPICRPKREEAPG